MPNKRKKKIFGTTERPRLVVKRSNKYIHAQLVDDSEHKVILGLYDKSKVVSGALDKAKTKVQRSQALGKLFAEEAKKKKISKIVFDRNGYKYTGVIAALADSVRENGIQV